MEEVIKKINGNLIEIKSNQNKDTFHISGGTGNIGQQINIFNTNSKESLYLVNQNKYLEYFINGNNFLRNMQFDKLYVIDFYFYFLSNFTKENNFEKVLNNYLLSEKKEKLKKNNIKKHLSFIKKLKKEKDNEWEVFLKEHFNSDKQDFIFDESEEEQNLIKEIESDSQKKLDMIKDTLSFIKNWDYEMYFFINYLIKTDFELFINSNDDELLFHAIGFLFYSNNSLYTSKIINFNSEILVNSNYYYNVREVEETYKFIIENRDRRNKKFIKDIVLNPKKIYEYKQYDRVKNFLEEFNIGYKININEIISNIDKLKEVNKIIDEYEKNKSQEEVNEIILNYVENLPLMESLMCIINKS